MKVRIHLITKEAEAVCFELKVSSGLPNDKVDIKNK